MTVIVASVFPGAAVIVGALSGVVPETSLEATPANPLNARISTGNVVPFAKPAITKGEVVTAGLGVTHVNPPSREY